MEMGRRDLPHQEEILEVWKEDFRRELLHNRWCLLAFLTGFSGAFLGECTGSWISGLSDFHEWCKECRIYQYLGITDM